MTKLSIGKKVGILGLVMLLVACAPVTSENNNRYQLTESGKMVPKKTGPKHLSLLVMQPVALDGYDTEQMLYVNKPFQVNAFANNSWMSPPATMLLPLVIRSIESTHYFLAVASDLNTSKTEYRVESALIRLQQNFLVKPSQLQLVMQVMLIHSIDSRVVAADTIYESIPCSKDTPLGGVLAANIATRQLTSRVAHFVVDHVKRDQASMRSA